MVEHEYDATERMQEIGVNAPRPIDAFEVNGLGVLVLEYLPEFESLDDVSDNAVAERAPNCSRCSPLSTSTGSPTVICGPKTFCSVTASSTSSTPPASTRTAQTRRPRTIWPVRWPSSSPESVPETPSTRPRRCTTPKTALGAGVPRFRPPPPRPRVRLDDAPQRTREGGRSRRAVTRVRVRFETVGDRLDGRKRR